MKPRLKQPLFDPIAYPISKLDPYLSLLVKAYDSIWCLTHKPDDMLWEDVIENAHANLEMLGSQLEKHYGEDVFNADAKQLTFPDEILNINNKNKP